MFSTLVTVALFVAPAIQGALADFAISSPDLVQCKSTDISWEPTKGPYNLIVVKSSDPCGDALVEVGDFSQTHISWVASIKAGTKVQLSLVDANDNEAWSKDITVGASDDTSCLSPAGSAAVSSAVSASTTGTAVVGTGASLTAAGLAPPAGSTTTASDAADTTGTADSSNTYGSGDSDSGIVPVGAANASKFTGAALTVRQASAPLMVISGLVAAFVLSL